MEMLITGLTYILFSFRNCELIEGHEFCHIFFVLNLPHLIRSFLKARLHLVLGQPLICSLFSLLFNCKFLAVMSISLSHTCGPAAVLQVPAQAASITQAVTSASPINQQTVSQPGSGASVFMDKVLIPRYIQGKVDESEKLKGVMDVNGLLIHWKWTVYSNS
ncbi:hypothetical protein MG293_014414 [Ovis ammon polii]|uniref:Uncharacterized protein n=1 Tax=Ovis ammon polii TaxID=230172 RepID=A0AAD4TVD0_OVIAM|nr:hypothetical protein MG293_014414 [Ovis ammon polii]